MLCKYRCIYSPTTPCTLLYGCQRTDIRRILRRRWFDNSRDILIYQLEFTTCLQIMLRQGSKVSRFKSVSGPSDYNYFNNKFTLGFHFCLRIFCKEKCSIFFLWNFSLIYMRQGRHATSIARNDVMIERNRNVWKNLTISFDQLELVDCCIRNKM